jgi:hypothetical protein
MLPSQPVAPVPPGRQHADLRRAIPDCCHLELMDFQNQEAIEQIRLQFADFDPRPRRAWCESRGKYIEN